MAKKNYYKMLGVSRTASPEEISAAKNRLAKKYHPDANMKNGIDTTRKMQQILEAYRILSDPKKRASYDLSLIHILYLSYVILLLLSSVSAQEMRLHFPFYLR